jgi:CMP-N,N'-diacetyllegionaminic acid synthase
VNILAIIPARGGSKGILMKNIVPLAGKPLISYTINSTKKSKFITRVIVSTDNEKIAKIAKKFGAEVPFLRPKKISGSNASTKDVIKHALDYLKKEESYIPDIVVLLQPTSPLRKNETIENAIKKFKREKPDILLEVSTIKSHPYRAFLPNGKFLKPFKKDFLKYHQRQLFPTMYYPTGELYIFWTQNFKKYKNIYGPKILPIVKPKNEISNDINNLFDLFISEMTIKYWKQYQKQFKNNI